MAGNSASSSSQALLTAGRRMNAAQAGAYLGADGDPISTTTLAWWRCKGKGPAYLKIGNRIMYAESALDAFIAQSQRAPSER